MPISIQPRLEGPLQVPELSFLAFSLRYLASHNLGSAASLNPDLLPQPSESGALEFPSPHAAWKLSPGKGGCRAHLPHPLQAHSPTLLAAQCQPESASSITVGSAEVEGRHSGL